MNCQMCGHKALGTPQDAGNKGSIRVCAKCKIGTDEMARDQGKMPYELYAEFLTGVDHENRVDSAVKAIRLGTTRGRFIRENTSRTATAEECQRWSDAYSSAMRVLSMDV